MKHYSLISAAAISVFAVTSCGLFKKQAPEEVPLAGSGSLQPVSEVSGQTEIHTMVQEKARYNGNLREFITKHLRYPEKAKENKIQGRVTVQFDITADGIVENEEVVRGLEEDCNNEAIRLIQLTSGSWKPEIIGGKPVRSTYTFPVDFKLN